MNKYTELSDLEINKIVAEELIQSGFIIDVEYSENYIFVKDKYHDCYAFDPCNNPTDAMPIIIENKICMNYIDGDIGWCAYHFDEEKGELEIYDKNYYRVAMILFLLMKDAENEG
ncbi:phage protein NinX family protein [Providencia vermicola]|uniref:phage protein NinX family protein n=1 Tax=Providencia vermicola TaxID=333965 RepID=UPI0032DA202E